MEGFTSSTDQRLAEAEKRNSNNFIVLSGTVHEELTFSHALHDERFYGGTLSVRRMSGDEDLIPIQIPGRLVETGLPGQGEQVWLWGSIRSRSVYSEELGKRQCHLYVFTSGLGYKAISSDNAEDNDSNSGTLVGTLCKDPVYRLTPKDREICDFLLAVNRRKYPGTIRQSDYIPCICWGRCARWMHTALKTGDQIQVDGRFQSRFYHKKESGEQKTAYEFSALKVTKLNKEDE